MKRIIALLCILALCAVLPLNALAEGKQAPCGKPGHTLEDGMNHNRPEPCWIKGHRNCDGRDHGYAPCGYRTHYNCDGRDHGAASCGAEGHTVCDPDKHAPAKCGIAGHCVSDDLKHYAASCGVEGHYACDGLNHRQPACYKNGHVACDGADHTAAVCGAYKHFNCDGREHAAAPCGIAGHCTADGLAHAAAPCGVEGHIDCVNGSHAQEICGVEGHYACDGKTHRTKLISSYCNAEPQHVVCEGDPQHVCDPENGGCGETYSCSDSDEHTICRMCGLRWCDSSLGSHYAPCKNANHRPCVYALQGKVWRASDHPKCHLCGAGKCTGRHGLGACVPVCDQCGESLQGVWTHRGACHKHFVCISSGSHSWCDKHNMYKCDCDCR